LENTTKKAYAMIVYYGFSDKLKNLSYYDSSGRSDYAFSKPYSEETAKLIDDEVKKLIEEQYERAKAILTEHKEGLAELAKILIEREVIFADDLEKIFGKRPWASRTEELMEANAKNKETEKEDMEEETEKPLPAENDEADETDENVAEREKQNNASENDLN
jgi:cell division protease FtsH